MFNKFKRKHFIILGLIVVLLIAISSLYYWWLGTPEYSMMQFRNAIKNHNANLALRYIDMDTIFEKLFDKAQAKLVEETSAQNDGWAALGMMLGSSMIQSYKPAFKEQIRQAMIDGITSTTTEETDKKTVEDAFSKDVTLKKENGLIYLEAPNGVKLILTKTPERYWKITDIEGVDLN